MSSEVITMSVQLWRQKILSRLHPRVVKTSEGCWGWNCSLVDGYGRVMIDGVTYSAHRLSYIAYNGVDLDDSELVLHTCDTRHCTNPAHLFLGSHQDNMKDMTEKGRRKGIRLSTSNVSNSDIQQFRDLVKCGLFSMRQIGKFYGVRHTTISYYVTGKGQHLATEE